MKLEWSHILSSATGYILVLVIRSLIDFRLAPFLVKKFHWVPLRTYFRADHYSIAGTWEHEWLFPDASTSHRQQLERMSLLEVWQLGKYVYGEFSSASVNYCLFGRIKEGNFIIGDWYDPKDRLGYYGIFELRIIDRTRVAGKWMGHSKTSTAINSSDWNWAREA